MHGMASKKQQGRYTERQMKQMFDFTDEQLRDIRNGDIDFGYCEVCELYFDAFVGELAMVDDQVSFIDQYCAKRRPEVVE